MNGKELEQLLADVARGATTVAEAASRLHHLPYEDIGFARIDHHRALRKGFPEVIFGQGKTAGQVLAILERMTGRESVVLVTRLDPPKAERVLARYPGAVYDEAARMLVWHRQAPRIVGQGIILVLAAGTSDLGDRKSVV